MTRHEQSTELDRVMELITRHGTDAMAEAYTTLLNCAMVAERQDVLGAAPYERSESRRGYANGFKPKTIDTRVGPLTLAVPKTRGVDFYPSALEKGTRAERALMLAIAEMYVKGVSTRKVTDILQQLCGLEVSSTQVSRAAAALDEQLEQWRNRPIGEITYLILDARYEKVREGGSVIDCAVLTAIGVAADGHRTILGVSCELSEAEVHWRSFLESLVRRGMHGVRLVVSDSHAGLKAARQAVLPSVPWQRCQFHLIQNAMAYVPKLAMRKEVAADMKRILTASDRDDAETQLRRTMEKYAQRAPRLAAWIEENVREGLTILDFPEPHRRRLRTTNGLERINREIKRRTRVATLFPNTASALRLVSAVLQEIDEEWSIDRKYLTMEATA